MIGSPPQRPPTRRAWRQAPTRSSPTTAFPNSCGRSVWRRARGLTVVLDADRPTQTCDELFRIATHVVFSAECLRATTGLDDLGAALAAIAATTSSFLAVTQGPRDVLWREAATLRRSPVFAVEAIDTLGAGDVYHGAFTLALAEGRDVVAALRFAAAAAGLKCTRLGGSMAAPRRAEVEALQRRVEAGLAIKVQVRALDRIS